MTEMEARLARLADRSRASMDAWEDDRKARDAAIISAEATGMGIREIAAITAMSTSQISRILTEAARD